MLLNEYRLEKESGFFFNMKYFEEKVQAGEWEEVEKYLSGFTKVDDNRYSMKIFFEIRKQKYLEALDRYVECHIIFLVFLNALVFVVTPHLFCLMIFKILGKTRQRPLRY